MRRRHFGHGVMDWKRRKHRPGTNSSDSLFRPIAIHLALRKGNEKGKKEEENVRRAGDHGNSAGYRWCLGLSLDLGLGVGKCDVARGFAGLDGGRPGLKVTIRSLHAEPVDGL